MKSGCVVPFLTQEHRFSSYPFAYCLNFLESRPCFLGVALSTSVFFLKESVVNEGRFGNMLCSSAFLSVFPQYLGRLTRDCVGPVAVPSCGNPRAHGHLQGCRSGSAHFPGALFNISQLPEHQNGHEDLLTPRILKSLGARAQVSLQCWSARDAVPGHHRRSCQALLLCC